MKEPTGYRLEYLYLFSQSGWFFLNISEISAKIKKPTKYYSNKAEAHWKETELFILTNRYKVLAHFLLFLFKAIQQVKRKFENLLAKTTETNDKKENDIKRNYENKLEGIFSFRSSHRSCSVKKLFLNVLQNSKESSCVGVSFLLNLQSAPATLLKKRLR